MAIDCAKTTYAVAAVVMLIVCVMMIVFGGMVLEQEHQDVFAEGGDELNAFREEYLEKELIRDPSRGTIYRYPTPDEDAATMTGNTANGIFAGFTMASSLCVGVAALRSDGPYNTFLAAASLIIFMIAFGLGIAGIVHNNPEVFFLQTAQYILHIACWTFIALCVRGIFYDYTPMSYHDRCEKWFSQSEKEKFLRDMKRLNDKALSKEQIKLVCELEDTLEKIKKQYKSEKKKGQRSSCPRARKKI